MKARTGEGRSIAREFARGAFGNVGILAANTLLSLLIAVLLSRALGAAGLGVYAFATSLMSILAAPLSSALGNIVLRETASAEARGNPEGARDAIRWALRTGVWLVGGMTALIGVGAAVGFGDLAGDKATTVFYALALPLPVAVLYIFSGAARGAGWIVLGRLPDLILRPLVFVACVIPIFLWPSLGPASPQLAMSIQVFAALFAAVVAFAIARLALGERGVAHSTASAFWGRPAGMTAWLASVPPLAFVLGLTSIQNNLDILMVDWYLPDHDVGIYRAGAQAGRLFFMVTTAVGAGLLPYVARLHAEGDHRQLQRLLALAARVSLAIVLPAYAIALAFGPWLLWVVFGAEFARGSGVFAVIAGGAVAQCLIGYASTVLSMTGRESQMVLAGMASVAVNVALNVVLIPRYGMDGAAWASTGAAVLLSVLLAVKAARIHGLRTWALG